MKLHTPLLALATALVPLLAPACSARARPPQGKLTGYDVLALPGERVRLRVKVERDGPGFINPDLDEIEIEFLRLTEPQAPQEFPDPGAPPPAEAVRAGAASSGKDGVAAIDIDAPAAPGDHRFWARLRDPNRLTLKDPAAPIHLVVMPPDGPIVITDIDNTIARTALGPLLDDKPDEVEPLPDAAWVLGALGRGTTVIYITARPTYLTQRTKRWLHAHKFPAGPVFLRDVGAEYRSLNFDEGEFKRAFIAEQIRKKWKEIRWGFGNTSNDLLGYCENGIRTILVGAKPDEIPAKYRGMASIDSSWKGIAYSLGLLGDK